MHSHLYNIEMHSHLYNIEMHCTLIALILHRNAFIPCFIFVIRTTDQVRFICRQWLITVLCPLLQGSQHQLDRGFQAQASRTARSHQRRKEASWSWQGIQVQSDQWWFSQGHMEETQHQVSQKEASRLNAQTPLIVALCISPCSYSYSLPIGKFVCLCSEWIYISTLNKEENILFTCLKNLYI